MTKITSDEDKKERARKYAREYYAIHGYKPVPSEKRRRFPLECSVCKEQFRGFIPSAKTCSRKCYGEYRELVRKKGGYWTVHAWVGRTLGKPNLCTFCGTTTGKFEWSNISQEYKEELSDWQRLCVPCHRKYDADNRKHKSAIRAKYGNIISRNHK